MSNHDRIVIEQLLSEEGNAWLGYHETLEWVILDRAFELNSPNSGGNAFRYFLALEHFEPFRLTIDMWHPPLLTYYQNLRGLNDWIGLRRLVENWRAKRSLALTKLRYYSHAPNHVQPTNQNRHLALLSTCIDGLTNNKIAERLRVPPADEADIKICYLWANIQDGWKEATVDYAVDALQKKIGKFDASRLISARLSEKTCSEYYTTIGRTATDVSIQQCAELNNGDWELFDLDVGYPVDVKNARPSFNGKYNFTNHCVPRFKSSRKGEGEVKIFGVISDYIADPHKTSNGDYYAIPLGEISKTEIDRLIQWINRRFGRILNAQGLWNPGQIPGWLYEYPEEHYIGLSKLKSLLDDLFADLVEIEDFLNENLWISLLCTKDLTSHVNNMSPRTALLIKDLRALFYDCGLSKRSIYIYLMGAVLEEISKGIHPRALIDDFRRVTTIRRPGSNRSTFPFLGLRDPVGYLESLANLLIRAADGISRYEHEIDGFRLTHPQIMRARFIDGIERTVIAYCGGWSLRHNVSCGFAPLVVGDHEYCPECWNLICEKCGYCKKTCPLNEQRQFERAREPHENFSENEYCGEVERHDEDPNLYDHGYWSNLIDGFESRLGSDNNFAAK